MYANLCSASTNSCFRLRPKHPIFAEFCQDIPDFLPYIPSLFAGYVVEIESPLREESRTSPSLSKGRKGKEEK